MRAIFRRTWRRIARALPVLGILLLHVHEVRLAAQGQKTLDLMQRPLSSLEGGAPGASGGGIGGRPSPGLYPLPLQVNVQSITKANPGTNRGSLVVEALVRNTGAISFYLPISLQRNQIIADGHKARRIFLFKLTFRSPGRPDVTTVAISTHGSESDPASLMEITPRESVLVRFQAELWPIWEWLEAGVKEIEIQAGCSEWTLEDDRYFIKAQSQELLSENAFKMSMQP